MQKLAFILLLATGCSSVVGNGVDRTETRTITDAYNGIHVFDGIQVNVTVGTADGPLMIRTDDNLLPIITTQVEAGALHIQAREGIDPTITPVVDVTVMRLEFASAVGDGSLITATNVASSRFGVAASNGSAAVISGTCDELVVIASGGANLDGAMMQCRIGRIDSQGGSTISVFVTEQLVVEASGESVIRVSGNPTIDERLTDDSRITQE